MPLPRALARFNVRVTNRLLGPIVRWVPGFGLLEHRGRRSGRRYRTPLLAFRAGDRWTFAATYGPETDWIRNVLTAGEATFVAGRRRWRLTEPRLYRDPQRRAVPWLVRHVLALLAANDFVEMRASPGGLDRPRRAGGAESTERRPAPSVRP